MLLQGELQVVFDALYSMGIIDPVLQKDWTEVLNEMTQHGPFVDQAITAINSMSGNQEAIVNELSKYDDETLEILAVEVAREYASFHTRGNFVH